MTTETTILGESTPDLDWALCRSLLAILREGSLSGASRVLRVAHPTMRRHLEALEAAVGAALFVRSPSGLVPTELAIALRGSAETMEAAFHHLVRTASADANAVAGSVRISASEVIGAEVLPAILSRLKAIHPGLVFEVDLSNAVSDVLRRDVDIAVRMVRPVQADLMARKVATVQVGFYAESRWLAAHEPPPTLEALVASGALIGDDRASAIVQGLSAHGVGATRGDFGFRSDSQVTQLAALRAGLGIGACQTALAARYPELRRILPDFAHPLEVWLVSHPDQRGFARVGATLEALAAGLAHYARSA